VLGVGRFWSWWTSRDGAMPPGVVGRGAAVRSLSRSAAVWPRSVGYGSVVHGRRIGSGYWSEIAKGGPLSAAQRWVSVSLVALLGAFVAVLILASR
jgi:hypothetical protein